MVARRVLDRLCACLRLRPSPRVLIAAKAALIPPIEHATRFIPLSYPVPGTLTVIDLADFPLCPGKHAGIQFP